MVKVKQGTEGPCRGSTSCHLNRTLDFGMFCVSKPGNETSSCGLPSRSRAKPNRYDLLSCLNIPLVFVCCLSSSLVMFPSRWGSWESAASGHEPDHPLRSDTRHRYRRCNSLEHICMYMCTPPQKKRKRKRKLDGSGTRVTYSAGHNTVFYHACLATISTGRERGQTRW